MAENPALSVFTHEHYIKNVVSDGVLETNVFANQIKSAGKVKTNMGGTKIGAHLHRSRQMTIEGWGSQSTNNVAQPDLHESWSHEWGGFISQFHIQLWDTLANENKEEAICQMLREYLENQKDDLDEYIEDLFFVDYSTLTPRQWGGLPAFMKKNGTYGGLSQASGDTVGNTRKAQIIGGGSASKPSTIASSFNTLPTRYLTYLLTQATRGKSRSKKNMIDWMITTRNGWNKIHGYLSDSKRVTTNSKLWKEGFVNFTWNSVPVMWSDSCTANRLFGINNSVMELWCQTKKLLQNRDYKTDNPIGHVYQAFTKSQIVCTNPRFMALLSTDHLG